MSDRTDVKRGVPRLFSASAEEVDLAVEWQNRHVCLLNKDERHITWTFAPTGIGDAITVTCPCGAQFNATDYGKW